MLAMSSAAQPRRRIRRPFEALWLALYALGMFAASLHYGLVAHRVCEHGEVAHVASKAHDAPEAAPSEIESTSIQQRSSESRPESPTTPDDDTHEHCELDPTTQPAAPIELAPITFAAWLELHFDPPALATPQPPRIAILRQAPGRSPPAV